MRWRWWCFMGPRSSPQPEADHSLALPLVQLALHTSLSSPMTSNREGDTTSFLIRVSLSLLYDTKEVWFFCWHRVKCYFFISICFTCLFFLVSLLILQFLSNYFSCSLQGKHHEFAIPLVLSDLPSGKLHTWAGMLLFTCACPVFRVMVVAEQSSRHPWSGRTIPPWTCPRGTTVISVGKAASWWVRSYEKDTDHHENLSLYRFYRFQEKEWLKFPAQVEACWGDRQEKAVTQTISTYQQSGLTWLVQLQHFCQL